MKEKFKKMYGMVTRFLGIASIPKDATGNLSLDAEQLTRINATFGSEFGKLFQQGLADGLMSEPEAGIVPPAAGTVIPATNAAAANNADGDLMSQMFSAMANHQAAELNNQVADLTNRLAAANGNVTVLQQTVAELSALPEQVPAPKASGAVRKGKEGVATVMKVDMSKPYYAALEKYAAVGGADAYAGTTIEVADLKQEFGTFLNVQRNLDILASIFIGFTSSKYMTTKLAVTEFRAGQALITSVVQQFTSEWTPSRGTKFTPITIKNRHHKINFPIKPADILDTYIMYLYDEGLSPDQMPITKYIMSTLLQPKILMDIEMRMVHKGRFVEVDLDEVVPNGPATPPEEGMDGFETILVDAYAHKGTPLGYNINFYEGKPGFNLFTSSDEDVLAHFNGFVDWISPIYGVTPMHIFCSKEAYKRYKRAYKNKYGQNSGDKNFGEDIIDFSNNTLVPLDGMYASPVFYATPTENYIKLRYKNQPPAIINDVQKSDYTVKVFGEFWLGVGFAIGEAVFAYVPAGYDPQNIIVAKQGRYDLFPGETDSEESGA
jgi:hypothetical protein